MTETPLFDRVVEAPPILTVSELTAQVQAVLDQVFPVVWVAGEIVSFKRHSSGHLYFSLKDSTAVIRAVAWRSTAQRLKVALADGMEVIIRGRLGIYAPRGDYQLYVDAVELKGVGAQDLALRQLKEKLAKLGYFAPERKRPLPQFPRCIALVTSSTGAAVRDMLEKLAQRWPIAEAWISCVRVQGDMAPAEIAFALEQLNRVDCVDVVILGRGGGSSEDLSAFNTEVVARAIFRSRAPVVSAVGHEIDVTIADLVADCRALTPSDAVVRATPDRAELLQGLANTRQYLANLLTGRLADLKQRCEAIAQRRVFRFPLERIQERARKLDEIEERLGRDIHRRLALARQQIDAQAARLEALSPLQVLARGYSLTRTADGKLVISRADQVTRGDQVEVLLAEGRLLAQVEQTLPASESMKLGGTP